MLVAYSFHAPSMSAAHGATPYTSLCMRNASQQSSDSVAGWHAVMSLTVGVMSLLVERLWTVLPVSPYFDSLRALTLTGGLMLCGGLIAFLMVWVEFTVISETSALTFMVAGTFKEIVTGAANALVALAQCRLPG